MITPDNVANVGAVAAVASPWWLPPLHAASALAAELLPIFGVLWLVTQICVKIALYRANKIEDE